MTNSPLEEAILTVCEEDGMSDDYRTLLMALIQNAMRNSFAREDINDLLNLIPVEARYDED